MPFIFTKLFFFHCNCLWFNRSWYMWITCTFRYNRGIRESFYLVAMWSYIIQCRSFCFRFDELLCWLTFFSFAHTHLTHTGCPNKNVDTFRQVILTTVQNKRHMIFLWMSRVGGAQWAHFIFQRWIDVDISTFLPRPLKLPAGKL